MVSDYISYFQKTALFSELMLSLQKVNERVLPPESAKTSIKLVVPNLLSLKIKYGFESVVQNSQHVALRCNITLCWVVNKRGCTSAKQHPSHTESIQLPSNKVHEILATRFGHSSTLGTVSHNPHIKKCETPYVPRLLVCLRCYCTIPFVTQKNCA